MLFKKILIATLLIISCAQGAVSLNDVLIENGSHSAFILRADFAGGYQVRTLGAHEKMTLRDLFEKDLKNVAELAIQSSYSPKGLLTVIEPPYDLLKSINEAQAKNSSENVQIAVDMNLNKTTLKETVSVAVEPSSKGLKNTK